MTGAEANSTVEYALNDGAYVASYDDIKGSITDGDTVYVRHTDLAGNVSSTSVTVTVDTTAPEMAGVADGSGIKTSGHVVYTITFDEPVLPGSIDLADFVFTGGDLTPSSVTATGTPDFGNATDGFTKVDIRFDVNGDGILDAALASTATIVDVAGNNFVFASGDAGFDQNIFSADMDNVPPTVTGITCRRPRHQCTERHRRQWSDGVTDADVLTFRVDFSEPVDAESLFQEIDVSEYHHQQV